MSLNEKKWGNMICIDLDGVIHKYSKKYHDGTIYDEPMDGAMEGIKELLDKGFKINILTARDVSQYPEIIKWFRRYGKKVGLTYDGKYKRDFSHEGGEYIFENVAITNIKRPAIAYIDDRGIRFISWSDTLNYFR